MVAWLGPRVPLARFVTEGSHPLAVQSYAAREMRGAVNADGFGVGWYADGDPRPCTYRNTAPIWADPNLASLGRAVASRCVLALVRNATPGMPYTVSDTAPFSDEATMFVHNGSIGDFRARMMRRLRAGLSDTVYAGILGGTDSEHVYALVRDRIAADRSTEAAVTESLCAVGAWARELGVEALLTVVVADGKSLVAARAAVNGAAPTLYALDRGAHWPGGVLLASERLDADPSWREVPAGTLLTVDPDGTVTSKELAV